MITDSPHLEENFNEGRRSVLPKIIAVVCALAVGVGVLVGYGFLRRRYAQQQLAKAEEARRAQEALAPTNVPKGPAKVHILVDDALLKGPQTEVRGSVKNISRENLSGLSVELEFRRRKDGLTDLMSIPLDPPQLAPDQEGRYSVILQTRDYGSARLVGVRTSVNSNLIAHISSPGQKRPPERLEPKIIIVQRPSSGREEFLNSPDKPARVP
jgi:hypothetical protein